MKNLLRYIKKFKTQDTQNTIYSVIPPVVFKKNIHTMNYTATIRKNG